LADGVYFKGPDGAAVAHHGATLAGRMVDSAEAHADAVLALAAEEGREGSVDFTMLDLAPTTLGEMAEARVIETEVGRDAHTAKLVMLSQLKAALRLLRPTAAVDGGGGGGGAEGGDLVARVGDCYTRLTAGVIYVLYRTFTEVRVVKPYLSSPSDPERFVVCTGYRGVPAEVDAVIDTAIAACRDGRCVLAFVPMQQLLEPTFMACLCRTNDRLAQRQLAALKLADAEDAVASDDDERFLALGNEAVDRINIDMLKHDPSRAVSEISSAHAASREDNVLVAVESPPCASGGTLTVPHAPLHSEDCERPPALANGVSAHSTTASHDDNDDGEGEVMATDAPLFTDAPMANATSTNACAGAGLAPYGLQPRGPVVDPPASTSLRPWGSIPIEDCGEPLEPLPAELLRIEPHAYVALGAPYGDGACPFRLRTGVIERLLQAQQYLMETGSGLRLAVFDAWRPLAVQRFMVVHAVASECRTRGVDPHSPSAELEQVVADVGRFWAAPSEDPTTPPPHSTGAAIDLTMADEHGQLVDMGSEIDAIGAVSEPDHYLQVAEKLEENGEDQKRAQALVWHERRSLLAVAMTSAGFQRHRNEWWHFSYGDQMWAWGSGHSHACYGRWTASST
jgi:D-alanyl-D-alanine dipeptidase